MKKYELIYVDPPWRYRSGKVQGAAINHYATMSDEELYQLPVAEIAADNCVLLLWATFPKLPEALRLIEAWGFQYKTVGSVWVKTNPSGNGFFSALAGGHAVMLRYVCWQSEGNQNVNAPVFLS